MKSIIYLNYARLVYIVGFTLGAPLATTLAATASVATTTATSGLKLGSTTGIITSIYIDITNINKQIICEASLNMSPNYFSCFKYFY